MSRTYYLQNRKTILKKQRLNYKKNKKSYLSQQKLYKQKHKKQISLQGKKYYLKNRKRIIKKSQIYYQKNKTKCMQKSIAYKNKRNRTEVTFRLIGNLRHRIFCALRGYTKSLNTMFLIGCEVDYLMYHIQLQFKEGMSWDNYGLKGWVIDHIKPCSKFDLSKKSEQIKCFNYTNLQPLWYLENISKGNKFND